MPKVSLRRQARALREALPPDQRAARSAAIRQQVLELPELARARSVFIYISAGSEVDTHVLIEALLARNLCVSVPLIVGRGVMEAHRIRGLHEVTPGPYGILAPAKPNLMSQPPDVSIVPALALTRRGDRLGAGGGYYDRYLTNHPQTLAIALCFDVQLVDDLPVAGHDQRVDLIVTESGLIRCNRAVSPGPRTA
ncbi:MAG TPA: 5-formyltetrahydrofolate cyclo-ligase [Phycisphaeraceae bacterium]